MKKYKYIVVNRTTFEILESHNVHVIYANYKDWRELGHNVEFLKVEVKK